MVDEGWAEGGARGALHSALTGVGSWWASRQPGVIGEGTEGVPGTPGWRDGARPDIAALLEAASAEEAAKPRL